MLSFSVSTKKEVCSLIVREGRKLDIGSKIEIIFNGSVTGAIAIHRPEKDLLLLTGKIHTGNLKRFPVLLYGWTQEYRPMVQGPDGSVRSAGASDLYSGGCKFLPDQAPPVKLFARPAAERLERQAKAAMREWRRNMMIQSGFKDPDLLGREERKEEIQRWRESLSDEHRSLFTRQKEAA